MTENNKPFEIEFLDHVAIMVADLEASSKWYEKVLGLKRYQLPKWGEFPIFLLSGKTGIALFPAENKSIKTDPDSKHIKIDHFAFNVTRENYQKAKQRYRQLNLDFYERDHYYFDSIYTLDPDGHKVELTTIKVAEKDFYK